MPKVSMSYAKKINKEIKKNIAKLKKQTTLSTSCRTISQPNNTRRQVSSHKVRQQQRGQAKVEQGASRGRSSPGPPCGYR